MVESQESTGRRACFLTKICYLPGMLSKTRIPQCSVLTRLLFAERDPSYSQARYRHADGDSPYMRGPALCSICMSLDFQGLTTNRKPRERYEVRYGGLQSFSSNCPLCRLLCEKVLATTPGLASSQIFVFDFVPIYATSPQGTKSSILDGLWFRNGRNFGHLVFSAPLGRLIPQFGSATI